jgi:limonene-1,2-epoxide hydrolase
VVKVGLGDGVPLRDVKLVAKENKKLHYGNTDVFAQSVKVGSWIRRGDLMDSAANVALIRRFIEVCVRAEPEEFASYFTEDAVWWNAPWSPVKGREAIRETLRRGAERMVALPWEIRHIVAEGDIVMTERVDNFLVGETRVSVPCMGVFELRSGKIAAWRDYWDLQQFERQLPATP